MNITVLGKGNVGGTLGRKWQAAGHEVIFGVRSPDPAEITQSPVGKSLQHGEVILLSVPGSAVSSLVDEHAEAMTGKIIIDATNSIGSGSMNCVDQLLKAVESARVVRAFHNLGWENFANPIFGDSRADLFYCSVDDADVIRIANQLIEEIGLRSIRVGGLDKVPIVDSLTLLWFALISKPGVGRHSAFRLLTEGVK